MAITTELAPTPAVDTLLDEARARVYEIDRLVKRTNVIYAEDLSSKLDVRLYLASDIHQISGSYKLRGATSFILAQEMPGDELVAASTGNHADAVSVVAAWLGIKSTIVMPHGTPEFKVERARSRSTGINVVLSGNDFDESQESAMEYAESKSLVFVPPFDDSLVIAGQGTQGLEIIEEVSDIDVAFAPVGGGGHSAGVFTAIRRQNPEAAFFGVEPEGAASLTLALNEGYPSRLEGELDKFVSAAVVRQVGAVPLREHQKLGTTATTVTNAEVINAQRELALLGLNAEPAGALALAGLTRQAKYLKGKRVVCTVTGIAGD